MKRWALRIFLAVLVVYLAFVGTVYSAMRREPLEFSKFMMRLPAPLMMIAPFPPMWMKAREGTLKPGDVAPDFDLERHDHSGRVTLAEHRGVRPVVLVFGSYT